MYRCDECGKYFEEPSVIVDDPSPGGVGLPSGAYKFEICPYCGNDFLTEAKECPVCGGWHTNDGPLCDDCLADLTHDINGIRIEMGMAADDFELALQDSFGW